MKPLKVKHLSMDFLSLRLIVCISIIALLLNAFSSPTSPELAVPPTASPLPAGPQPEVLSYGMVDVGGRRLSFNCTGQGSPTVILEAGSGSASYDWFQVQSGSENSYRVCSYDRANLGYSDAAPKPRTYLDMAGDLHALLVNTQIAGPYILVGHSGGGLLVRVFADQYPAEVAGLVLVDSAHPDMGSRLLAGLPPKSIFEPKAIREWRIWLNWMDDSHRSLFKDLEGLDTQASNAQVKAAKPLGDLPLVVISRSPDNAALEGRSELPAETNLKLRRIWQDLQNELVEWSSNSTHLIAAHAGHRIPAEEPELIIEAIGKLVNEARSQMGLTEPSALPEETVHAPKILRVEDRQVTRDDQLVLYKDFTFTDPGGDAEFVSLPMTSADPPREWLWPGGFVEASVEEQEHEAKDYIAWACERQETIVLEMSILDRARNRSEPVTLTFSCPAPKKNGSIWLIGGLMASVGLLAAAYAWQKGIARRQR